MRKGGRLFAGKPKPLRQDVADPSFLRLDPETQKEVGFRLKSARGHLDSVIRQLERPDVYCVDALQQLFAVQGALTKVNALVLRSHIHNRVTIAIEGGDIERTIQELLDAVGYTKESSNLGC